TKIIQDLINALSSANLKASVDKNTGDIVLESSVFFDVGKFTIKESGQKLLNQFIPLYLSVLLRDEYVDYLGEIIIEGHTDTQGTYLSNLELSQQRALTVATYCLEMPGLTEQQQTKLRQVLTAKGRSYSDPVYADNGVVDMDASRRVEFKFRLKDSEMIDEMRAILSTGEEQ
ncbi:MAG: OmpA family protein, partial [Clostridia bacterium]|nr:OmpA family protein [Clostridia bacterium]